MANVTIIEKSKKSNLDHFTIGKYYINTAKVVVICTCSGSKLIGTIIKTPSDMIIGDNLHFVGDDWELFEGKIIIEQ